MPCFYCCWIRQNQYSTLTEQTLPPQDAWVFTRANAGYILREEWLGFAVIALLAVAIDVWFKRACNLGEFACYPALAASVRIVHPNFRLDRSNIIGLLIAGFATLFAIAVPGASASCSQR